MKIDGDLRLRHALPISPRLLTCNHGAGGNRILILHRVDNSRSNALQMEQANVLLSSFPPVACILLPSDSCACQGQYDHVVWSSIGSCHTDSNPMAGGQRSPTT
jgi:hypothetical protein